MGSPINDVTVVRGEREVYCDDSTKVLVIKRVTMGEGVKNCPELRHIWTIPMCDIDFSMKTRGQIILLFSEFHYSRSFVWRKTERNKPDYTECLSDIWWDYFRSRLCDGVKRKSAIADIRVPEDVVSEPSAIDLSWATTNSSSQMKLYWKKTYKSATMLLFWAIYANYKSKSILLLQLV